MNTRKKKKKNVEGEKGYYSKYILLKGEKMRGMKGVLKEKRNYRKKIKKEKNE